MIIVTPHSSLSEIDFQEGCLIPFDKDATWTSFDVVNKVRRTINVKKVGHAGTLDPLATGLVLLCTGKYTKKLNDLMGLEKEYTGTITFGKTTPSYDLETETVDSGDASHLDLATIQKACKYFIGSIEQIPPIYSAIKIDGERAYKKARKNVETKMQPRQVTINELEVTSYQFPDATFRMVCSKGTYVRSMAHDLGQHLQVGAHLSQLTRTRIGKFHLSDAWKVSSFVESFRSIEQ